MANQGLVSKNLGEAVTRRRHKATTEGVLSDSIDISPASSSSKDRPSSTAPLQSYGTPPARREEFAIQRPLPEFSTHSPEFCGPSSTEYTFNAVNGNLRAMGMQSAIPDKHLGSRTPSTFSGRLAQYGPFMKLLTMDPLWDLTKQDAHALIDDWCAGLGTVYPIVSRRSMIETANNIFDALNLARAEGLRQRGGPVAEALFDHNTNKLKIILAISITKEAGGRDHQAERLFQSTSEAVEGLIWNPEGIHCIQLLYLVAMYHYHLNEEVRTGRCIAFAARLCLEAGLHRRAMLNKVFPDPQECSEALQAFWAVYMFERRLSLGQGIPFSIQDNYIDKSLYTFEIENPLLVPLLQWTKLAGKTWHALNNQVEKTYESRVDDINYLDFQIMEWYQGLPEHLKIADIDIWTQDASRQPTYYHSILFVRKAHLRNLIYRPILQPPPHSRQNEAMLLKAIEISKETIHTVYHLNEHTTLVLSHPMFFQQLLLTAFGNLLLAVVSTAPKIWNSAREGFDLFLNIFQRLSLRCAALRRTWQRLQGLRDLHTKFGHSDRNAHATHSDPSENADDNTTSATTLSFEDIFPDVPGLSTFLNAFDSNQQPATDVRFGEEFSSLPDEFFGSENFFDFPFLNLENSM